jgi:protein TonB
MASMMAPPVPPLLDQHGAPKHTRSVPPNLAFRFESLVLSEPHSLVKGRSLTLTISLVLHSVLIGAAVLVPLIFFTETLPATDLQLRAFFAAPPDVPAPPPPPPPPPAGVQAVKRAPAEPLPEPGKFVAPIEVPSELPAPEEGLDLGVEGGVAGGVEGGVPGGVVGGVVGGIVAPPPPPARVVRIGGGIVAPKLVKQVKPVYPQLAVMSRAKGLVILEATVDVRGYVKSVKILRSQLLFDEAAVEAVKQWRYQPLLLNGEPTEFILAVTMYFDLVESGGTKQ